MGKVISTFIAILRGIGWLLSAMDWLALAFLVILFVVSVPFYLLDRFTEIEQPLLISIALILMGILLGCYVMFRKKKCNERVDR